MKFGVYYSNKYNNLIIVCPFQDHSALIIRNDITKNLKIDITSVKFTLNFLAEHYFVHIGEY